ncbi:TPA: hypothetical protein N0F65_008904, partial [Lagenidium giganteum]
MHGSKDPTPVSEVAQLMEDDVHTADLATKQDQCTRDDAAMKSAEKIVDSCADPDQFVKLAVDNPMAANTAVMTEMAKLSTKVTELATLYFANRVFGATSPTKDVTFRVKWSANMKTRVPKIRVEVIAAIEELYTLGLEDRTRLTLALAFVELFLMCTAPLLFHNDRWIQRLTGQPVAWIPGHHTRFLHPNTLLALLRSDFGAVCRAQMIVGQWDGVLFDDLDELSLQTDVFDEDTAVAPAGHHGLPGIRRCFAKMVTTIADASSWNDVALRSVNTNGIKKNGHLLVSHLLAKHSLSCIQETKFRDSKQLATFQFHLDAAFNNKLFVSDAGATTLATATDFVLGDFNLALDPTLDASSNVVRPDRSRAACRAWLSTLGVVDAWRDHNPEARVYTGPQPRKNRLDYVFVSEQFVSVLFAGAKYFAPTHAGDHLAHQVSFRSARQLQGHGYWRFPAHLLEYPDIVRAIQQEAQTVLEQLHAADNPGRVWERWKRAAKRKIQHIQRQLREQDNSEVDTARAALDAAASLVRQNRDDDDAQHALETYRSCIERASCYNQDSKFDFHAQQMERSTRHFFRPLNTTLRRVTIEEVQQAGGTTSVDPLAISESFLNHWGSVMGDVERSTSPPTPPDPACQRQLRAIKHMRANAAPGLDGLTAGFYQTAPAVFGDCLSIVFNHQLQRSTLLPTSSSTTNSSEARCCPRNA